MSRLPGLDLLRAIAVIWVMLFHSFLVGGLGPDFAWLSRYGWMGVDIFFVLSGFLIGSQVLAPLARGERLSFARFLSHGALTASCRRSRSCWRSTWPSPACMKADGMAPWWQFATFTMNLLVDYDTQASFSHAWSLCVEEHFYLVFPALAWWLTRRPSAREVRRGCACWWCSAASRCAPASGCTTPPWIRRATGTSRTSTTRPGTGWMACWPASCWRRSRCSVRRCGRAWANAAMRSRCSVWR